MMQPGKFLERRKILNIRGVKADVYKDKYHNHSDDDISCINSGHLGHCIMVQLVNLISCYLFDLPFDSYERGLQ